MCALLASAADLPQDMENATGESRRFKAEVQRCNECKRVLRYLTSAVNAYLDDDDESDSRAKSIFAGSTAPPTDLGSIENLLDTVTEYERNIGYNTNIIREANKKINKKREHRLVLEKCSNILHSVETREVSVLLWLS